MHYLLDKLIEGQDLSACETGHLFTQIVGGHMNKATLAALLIGLKIKGETPREIAGAAFSLRDHCRSFDAPNYPFADSCGTGGDKQSTINVSTAVAFLAAECGLPIVKHGNRAVTSKCGSADVLAELGANIDISPGRARSCLDANRITFLFAPRYHPGIKNAMDVRRQLATSTIFNILGPLINPARPPIQILGVFSPDLCRPMAETLKLLGVKSALVVHGAGLDEIATHDVTMATMLKDGAIEDIEITPQELGIARRPLSLQNGGNPKKNAGLLEAILSGRGRPEHNEIVAANTGPLLYLAGLAESFAAGTGLALETLAGGTTIDRLQAFIEHTNMDIAA